MSSIYTRVIVDLLSISDHNLRDDENYTTQRSRHPLYHLLFHYETI